MQRKEEMVERAVKKAINTGVRDLMISVHHFAKDWDVETGAQDLMVSARHLANDWDRVLLRVTEEEVSLGELGKIAIDVIGHTLKATTTDAFNAIKKINRG